MYMTHRTEARRQSVIFSFKSSGIGIIRFSQSDRITHIIIDFNSMLAWLAVIALSKLLVW